MSELRDTVTGPPSGEYLMALSMRFATTWRSWLGSAATTGSRSGESSSSATVSGVCARAASTSVRTIASGSHGSICTCSFPESSWLASRSGCLGRFGPPLQEMLLCVVERLGEVGPDRIRILEPDAEPEEAAWDAVALPAMAALHEAADAAE